MSVSGSIDRNLRSIFAVFLLFVFFHAGGGPKTKKAGRWMRKLVNLNLQITQFGFCCVYFVFMADNVGHVINQNANLELSSRVSPSLMSANEVLNP